jgi:hypothetical protein
VRAAVRDDHALNARGKPIPDKLSHQNVAFSAS